MKALCKAQVKIGLTRPNENYLKRTKQNKFKVYMDNKTNNQDGITFTKDRNIIKVTEPNGVEKTRYSNEELLEFKELIQKKLTDAKKEIKTLQAQLKSTNSHGTDDTARTFKILDDGPDTIAKEELGQLANRQQKFIEQLESALVRIETKTYGICCVSGKLIPKERLKIVPHTTQSIEAKLNQY